MTPLFPSAPLVERFRRDLVAVAGDEPERLAVAVSGGPDSLALLLLAAAALAGRIEAATVDHGLRPESAREARAVAALCEQLEVPHSALRVSVDPTGAGLQQAAREARYAALAGWMRERALFELATAHHLDDQAETLLMRLLRGSGVRGLSAMRPCAPVPGAPELRLLRPLLAWRREELAGIAAEAGIEAAADPSNLDPRFDRARLRANLAEAPWLEAPPLARSAAALAEADAALDWAAGRLWEERVESDGAAAGFRAEALPPELVRRILTRLFDRFALGPTPRGDEIGRLVARLERGETATLAGVKCTGGDVWKFEPAPPRRAS